jgi:nucleoside-diphosphate-sugar epimerase
MPVLKPVVPDPGIRFQLVHENDVASAFVAGVAGKGEPGPYNLAARGTLTMSSVAKALDWYSVPVPDLAVRLGADVASRLSFLSAELEWANVIKVPVLMETAKARRELGWEPLHDAHETLLQTVDGARAAGILG